MTAVVFRRRGGEGAAAHDERACAHEQHAQPVIEAQSSLEEDHREDAREDNHAPAQHLKDGRVLPVCAARCVSETQRRNGRRCSWRARRGVLGAAACGRTVMVNPRYIVLVPKQSHSAGSAKMNGE